MTDMCNINNPALQAERLVLLSDKNNLFYQGHTALRSCTVRSDFQWKQRTVTYDTRGRHMDTRGRHTSNTCTPHKLYSYSCCLTGTTLPLVLGVRSDVRVVGTDPCHTSRTAEYPPIGSFHRCGRPYQLVVKPAGKLWHLSKVLYVFEHKTEYLLIHAPFTHIVVFWLIGNVSPMIS